MLSIGVLINYGLFESYDLMSVHKSLGITILLAMVIRVIWRCINIKPQPIHDDHTIRNKVAHVMHISLYVLIFSMILIGWVMFSAGGHVTYF